MASSPQFITTVKNPAVAFANADGTAFKSVMVAGTSGSRLDSLIATSTDSASNIVQLAVTKSGTDFVIGEVTVPANAGTNGVAKSVAVLNVTDVPGLAATEGGGLYLESGAVLKARPKTAVAGVFALQLTGFGGDY